MVALGHAPRACHGCQTAPTTHTPEDIMSRTVHTTADPVTTSRRGQVKGRPPVRRTGTRSAVIAAALAEYGEL